MSQQLISVVIKNQHGSAEEATYRVNVEARFVDVVKTACDRSELPGNLRCVQIMPLGPLEPRLFSEYVSLFDPRDITDVVP